MLFPFVLYLLHQLLFLIYLFSTAPSPFNLLLIQTDQGYVLAYLNMISTESARRIIGIV